MDAAVSLSLHHHHHLGAAPGALPLPATLPPPHHHHHLVHAVPLRRHHTFSSSSSAAAPPKAAAPAPVLTLAARPRSPARSASSPALAAAPHAAAARSSSRAATGYAAVFPLCTPQFDRPPIHIHQQYSMAAAVVNAPPAGCCRTVALVPVRSAAGSQQQQLMPSMRARLSRAGGRLVAVAAVGDVAAEGNTYLIAGAVAVALVGTAFPIFFSRKDTCPECDGAGFIRKAGSRLRANAARKDQAQIVCPNCNGLGKLGQIDKQ